MYTYNTTDLPHMCIGHFTSNGYTVNNGGQAALILLHADNHLNVTAEGSGYTGSATVPNTVFPSLMVSPGTTMTYVMLIIGDTTKCRYEM